MRVLERVEALLRQRHAGWWEALCREIPELEALAGTPQPPAYHAEGDVAIHTRLAIESCPQGCDPDLPWIALLHDIGKPATTVSREDGRITAHGHAKLGAELAESILARLGMPAERRARIVWVVRHHMFHHSWQLHDAGQLTNRQRGYLTDPRFPLLLEFLRVDALAAQGKAAGLQAYEFYRELLKSTAPEKTRGS